MALASISITKKTIHGNTRVRMGTANLGSSYTADGESITPAQFGLKKIHFFEAFPEGDATNAFVLRWDRTNSKILAYEDNAVAAAAPLTEDAAAGNHTTFSFAWKATGV